MNYILDKKVQTQEHKFLSGDLKPYIDQSNSLYIETDSQLQEKNSEENKKSFTSESLSFISPRHQV